MIGPVAVNFTSNAICFSQIKQCYMCSIKNSQFLIQSLMTVVGPAIFSCFSFQYSKHRLHMHMTYIHINEYNGTIRRCVFPITTYAKCQLLECTYTGLQCWHILFCFLQFELVVPQLLVGFSYSYKETT